MQAPAGPLGLQLENGRHGPAVNTLAPCSPLQGRVAAGWALLSVNGRSVSGMSCHRAAETLRKSQQQDVRELLFLADPAPPWTPLHASMVVAVVAFVTIMTTLWMITVGMHMSQLLALALLPLPTLVLLNQWRCIAIGPGYAAGSVNSVEIADQGGQETSLTLNSKRCHHCCCAKPPGTHHCSACGRCVLKMDHHCYWLGGCVGQNNYNYFLQLEGYGLLACVVFGLTSLWRALALAIDLYRGIGKSDQDALFKIAEMALTFGMATALIIVGAICFRCVCLHIKLLSEGRTTLEHLYGSRGPEAKGDDHTEVVDASAETQKTGFRPLRSPRATLENVFGQEKTLQGMPALWLSLMLLYRGSKLFRLVVEVCRIH